VNRPDANGDTAASRAIGTRDDNMLIDLHLHGATGVAEGLDALESNGYPSA
jgi:hypothetical protein